MNRIDYLISEHGLAKDEATEVVKQNDASNKRVATRSTDSTPFSKPELPKLRPQFSSMDGQLELFDRVMLFRQSEFHQPATIRTANDG